MSERYVPISTIVKNTEGCRLATCKEVKGNEEQGDCQAILVALGALNEASVWSRMSKNDLAESCGRFSRVGCPNIEAVLEAIRAEK